MASNARLRRGSARLRAGSSEGLFIPASVRIGFQVRIILRKTALISNLGRHPGLHVIKAKGLNDAVRRSNSMHSVTAESDFPCSFYGKT